MEQFAGHVRFMSDERPMNNYVICAVLYLLLLFSDEGGARHLSQ